MAALTHYDTVKSSLSGLNVEDNLISKAFLDNGITQTEEYTGTGSAKKGVDLVLRDILKEVVNHADLREGAVSLKLNRTAILSRIKEIEDTYSLGEPDVTGEPLW